MSVPKECVKKYLKCNSACSSCAYFRIVPEQFDNKNQRRCVISGDKLPYEGASNCENYSKRKDM